MADPHSRRRGLQRAPSGAVGDRYADGELSLDEHPRESSRDWWDAVTGATGWEVEVAPALERTAGGRFHALGPAPGPNRLEPSHRKANVGRVMRSPRRRRKRAGDRGDSAGSCVARQRQEVGGGPPFGDESGARRTRRGAPPRVALGGRPPSPALDRSPRGTARELDRAAIGQTFTASVCTPTGAARSSCPASWAPPRRRIWSTRPR
jgi:hypothetical protein